MCKLIVFCAVLASAVSARAQFPIHVGGSIALRIDNEVTVACFERTLSDLHQLGYTKIFVLVDGNRFICL